MSGITLAVLRGWIDLEPPTVPQLVAPASRKPVHPAVASVRRVARWSQLSVESGPYGLSCLSVLDAVIMVAPLCDDGLLHTLIQARAFAGDLDVGELMRRRRTGLPGSARISRVGARYLLGLDSPREVEVFNVLRFYGCPPRHLNVLVASRDGVTVGPFDGYDDGCAYEVDGGQVHGDAVQQDIDRWKAAQATSIELELVRFSGPDITSRAPMYEGWTAARRRAAMREVPGLTVIHQYGRSCPCGHRPE